MRNMTVVLISKPWSCCRADTGELSFAQVSSVHAVQVEQLSAITSADTVPEK